MLAPPTRLISRLAYDESGATAVVVAVTLTALMGFAAMAIDVGHWYGDKRLAQGAADAAAYSAAVDMAAGDTIAGATAAAKAVTAQYGLTNGANGVTVTVNNPPSAGPNASNAGAIEVIVNKSESLFFASFFARTVSVASRSVALVGSAGGLYSVLALNPASSTSAATTDISLNNGADLDLTASGLADNASGPDALYVSGGAKLTAKDVTLVGNYTVNNGSHMTVTNPVSTGAASTADPYATVATPAPNGCDQTNFSVQNKTQTLSPGTYCNGLTIGNASNVTMSAGVYVIDRGSFAVAGGSRVTATAGVTIVLTSSTGGNYATSQIDNGTQVTLTAPATGPTKGLAMMMDRNAPASGSVTFAGGSQMTVTGAIYVPSQLVNWSNGSTNGASCTQLIAWAVNFSGGSKFSNQCAGAGVTGIGSKSNSLVE